MARVGPAIGMPVKAPENYANTLNSNSQIGIGPANPLYDITMASKNMFAAIIRHGQNIYRHIMTAGFDPVYGREMSIAQQEERPATRFPLAETTRPHERSENNAIAFSGGHHININEANPFKNSVMIYDGREQGRKENTYKPYSEDYHGNYRKKKEDNPTNKNPLKTGPLYKIESIAKAVEQKGREYSRKVYDAFAKRKKIGEGQISYETGLGISAKVAYLGQKLKGYAGKVTGYNPQSKPQEQASTYEGQDTQIPTYILPTSYVGIDTRPTSIDENLMEQEIQVPQDVLDATIADAEEFLRQMRIKNSDPANASGLDLIVLK